MKTWFRFLFAFLAICSPLALKAQIDIYMKITTVTGNSPSKLNNVQDYKGTVDLTGYIQVSSIQFDFAQTNNSVSGGSTGAGKITFNPLVITKQVNEASGPLFQAMASGSSFPLVDFVLIKSSQGPKVVINKITFKQALVKTMAVSSANCDSVAESISFDYGAYVLTTNSLDDNGTIKSQNIAGWSRLTNTKDINPSVPLK
ncbi:hypothetical protein GO755_38540 [Spirosoma sp. HMF4905]|uniref:Type VI secretion system tube protein Hcp n=1 Tax=Spirosoma arboris TaxID=2682092 RepID=A0A7K1SQV4_9BACT|nr:type VI secretion system tube protein Hcp [Spirosoma arboris]MVM35976.1 hypothetical protein [Spirosoma arboris]